MKYCIYCSAQLPDDALFCGTCGKSQQGGAAPQQHGVHPDVADLNPAPVDAIARAMREKIPELPPDEIFYYRSLDGNKIILEKEAPTDTYGNVSVIDAQNTLRAKFYAIDFFEQHYNNDPRQCIRVEEFTFGEKSQPDPGARYTLGDGDTFLCDENGIGIFRGNIIICWFYSLEDFFRYYKLRPGR